MLCLVLKLGYKRVVLLGCEMNKNAYFFQDLRKFQWMDKFCVPRKRWALQYEGMVASKNKHPFDKTVHAFNEFVFKPKGIELFVARKENVLYPEIPYVDILKLDKADNMMLCREDGVK